METFENVTISGDSWCPWHGNQNRAASCQFHFQYGGYSSLIYWTTSLLLTLVIIIGTVRFDSKLLIFYRNFQFYLHRIFVNISIIHRDYKLASFFFVLCRTHACSYVVMEPWISRVLFFSGEFLNDEIISISVRTQIYWYGS